MKIIDEIFKNIVEVEAGEFFIFKKHFDDPLIYIKTDIDSIVCLDDGKEENYEEYKFYGDVMVVNVSTITIV